MRRRQQKQRAGGRVKRDATRTYQAGKAVEKNILPKKKKRKNRKEGRKSKKKGKAMSTTVKVWQGLKSITR